MKTFKCKICGKIFDVEDGVEPVCPLCKAKGDKLEELKKANPYEGTQTEKNLLAAFAGESQARNKYTYFASKAKKEGYEQISALFLKTAENEKEHAKLFLKQLSGSEHLRVNAEYPFVLGDTSENLKSASQAEYEECETIYANAANIAKEEGFTEIHRLFSGILQIEKRHAYRFETILDNLSKGTVFKKEEQTQWICRKCGNCLISKQAPEKCPVCSHPQGYYEIFTEKF